MKIRNLKGKDIFAVSKLFKKLDIDLNTKNADGTDKTQMEVGAEVIQTFISNLHLVEEDANEFLGSLVNMTGEQFGELDIDFYFEVIEQFKDAVMGTDFFTKLKGLIQ